MSETTNHYDIMIIGSGPAGYTAAIYAGRANLKTLVIEGIERGGQLMITTDIENFPGFPQGITGPDLMESMRKQAERFGSVLKTEYVNELKLSGGAPFRAKTSNHEYTSDVVILATGASARFLDIPSEQKFKGKGVSACATCDGFFYKERNVIVVGGGDTAMEEATFLTRFAKKVIMVHRRDVFRASQIMLQKAKENPKIEILTFKAIDEIMGNDFNGTVNRVRLKDLRDNSTSEMDIDGIFVAIGHDPNTKIVEGQLELNPEKYIITLPGRTATKIPGVFAAGDVADPYYRQAITAAGSGAAATIEAERYLTEK